MEKEVIVYVNLPEEETLTLRATKALDKGDGIYQLLKADNYDPEDEVWEFLPESVVLCKVVPCRKGECLLAFEQAPDN